MTVLPFVLAAMQSLSPLADHSVLGTAIAARVDAESPLFADDVDRRKTAAWLVAIAYRESSFKLDAVGDKGQSLCAFQVGRSSGGTAAMLTDADACVGAAFPMLRTSMRLCRAFPLAWYAAGGDAARACAAPRAQRISRDRSALAARLLRDTVVVAAATEVSTPAALGFGTPAGAASRHADRIRASAFRAVCRPSDLAALSTCRGDA
jgi:hypothetical protein